VVFKRRDRRSIAQVLRTALWPRGGWARAFHYVKHRVRRLPDTPEKIARGVAAGVFAAFTPFYGFHFMTAALVAWMLRGNILASLLGTFFGNPLTYVPIGVVVLQTGHFILGSSYDERIEVSLLGKFAGAGQDLWNNVLALFTGRTPHWDGLILFYHDVFLPYLVGGIVPGALTAAICYYLTVPLVRVYQNRRKGRLAAKLAEVRARATRKHDGP
jgi:uncharacterized protein